MAQYTGGMDAPEKRRWYCPTPAWLVLGSLAVEGLLWLSERYTWFWFNEKKGWTVLIAVAVVGGTMILMLLWFLVALIFRWRFQFSIRSLLVLMVAVAIPCSWLAVEMKAATNQAQAVEKVYELHGSVEHDWNEDSDGEPIMLEPAWLRDWLGNEFFSSVVAINLEFASLADDDLAFLTSLPRLQTIELGCTRVTDTGLSRLTVLTELTSLRLRKTSVSDSGLAYLQTLPQLSDLDLGFTRVTDDGVRQLRNLPRLERLCLDDTAVTDAGLQYLVEFPHLKEVVLTNTATSDAGLKTLQDCVHLTELWLIGTRITDAGLESVKGMACLERLAIGNTNVTDAGLKHLEGLKKLQLIEVEGSRTSPAGLRKLQQALPNCDIM